MREGRPSATATIVACARGAAGIDPVAEQLVPGAFARLARPRDRRWGWLVPLVDFMRVRTVAIDQAVIEATRRGTTQVVVLGAGLCARAWRMRELHDSVVYEVDHPATQRYKRTRLHGLEPKARQVRFVSVDFEKDDLTRALEQAGHDASAPTAWVWEGVTPYLTPSAMESTLVAIRSRSAAGSVLAMTYYTPAVAGAAGRRFLQPRQLLRWSRLLLSAIGEPLHGLTSVESMHRALKANGFEVKADSTNAELAERTHERGALAAASEQVVTERLLVAVAI